METERFIGIDTVTGIEAIERVVKIACGTILDLESSNADVEEAYDNLDFVLEGIGIQDNQAQRNALARKARQLAVAEAFTEEVEHSPFLRFILS